MHRTILSTALSIALAACVLGPAPAYATAGVTQAAAEDAPAATPAGTTFVIPDGWASEQREHAVLLMPPEADGEIAAKPLHHRVCRRFGPGAANGW